MSTTIQMGECCLSGHLHSGTPKGQEEQFGGVDVYVSKPSNESKVNAIIMLSDIFGWKLRNTRLLADEYARHGFLAYLPDLHFGDSIPEALLHDDEMPSDGQPIGQIGYTTDKLMAALGPWSERHRDAVSRPIVERFVNAVKILPGVDKIGTVGFCWGGRYAILSAHDQVDAAVAFHPTWVEIPKDFEGLSKPLAIGHGDKDFLVPEEVAEKMKEALKSKPSVPTEFEVYQEASHGFAVRGDLSSEKDKQAMDRAEKQAVDWFKKHLS